MDFGESYKKIKYRRDLELPGKVNIALIAVMFIMSFIQGVMTYVVPGNFISAIFGIVGLIISLTIYSQWIGINNKLIDNTTEFFSGAISYFPEKEKYINYSLQELKSLRISSAGLWLYGIFMFIFNFIIPSPLNATINLVLSVVGIVLFYLMARKILIAEEGIQRLSNGLFSHIASNYQRMHQIKPRNLITVILLSIITVGIYFIYFLIKNSLEINEFVEAEYHNRTYYS